MLGLMKNQETSTKKNRYQGMIAILCDDHCPKALDYESVLFGLRIRRVGLNATFYQATFFKSFFVFTLTS